MRIMMDFSFHIRLQLLLVSFLTQMVCGQIGVAYSPFVRNDDHPNSAAYTRDDVVVMLKLIDEAGYPVITTYGVGSPGGQYTRGETWKRCSSVVHSALAAAEINIRKRALAMTIYQGLYVNTDALPFDPSTEIEVGFEVAMMANEMFQGTVAGLIFPHVAGVDTLLHQNVFRVMENVSARARHQGLMFGTRVWDCVKFAEYAHTKPSVRKLVSFTDFVICSLQPRPGDFAGGPGKFLNYTLDIVSTVKTAFQQIDRNANIRVILETGWPGGESLGRPNTEVSDMIQFWNLTKTSNDHMQVFMHEAFDNPWKKSYPVETSPLARFFGRWEHKQIKNDNSKNAYKFKIPTMRRKEQSGTSKELVIGLVFGSALFVLLAIMIVVVYRRVSHKIKRGNRLSEEEIRQFLDGIVTNEVVDETKNGNENWKRIPYNRDFELAKDNFTIDKNSLLGSGQFGSVYKGKINGLVNEVAFKTTRPDCPLSALRGLLSEIKILAYLGKHDNLVSLCGAYTAELTEGNVFLAIELCPNGSLERCLRSSKSEYMNDTMPRYVSSPNGKPTEITDLQLLKWSLDIASAMEYISSKNVIHADLATRNVLLTQNLTAKVTDFGLSRRLYEYTEYVKKHQEPLPWRWMALESLRALQFSTQSDVWSYGVTLWEIYSFGDVPYPGLAWTIEFVSQLENGLRMQKPTRATPFFYDIMTKCWHMDPHNRPTFKMIKEALQTIRNISSK